MPASSLGKCPQARTARLSFEFRLRSHSWCNRDELHARPTAPLARWQFPEHLLAGRDLQSGGTWLGVSEQGRFAAITNVTGYGAPQPDRASRGVLVTDFLTGIGRYADPEAAELTEFNPFNAVAVNQHSARVLTDRPTSLCAKLPPGIHGLSNGVLGETCPRAAELTQILQNWMETDATEPARLLENLGPESLGTDELSVAPGADKPIFIRDAIGTRCSTVVAIDAQGAGMIVERRFNPAGVEDGRASMSFNWHANVPLAGVSAEDDADAWQVKRSS